VTRIANGQPPPPLHAVRPGLPREVSDAVARAMGPAPAHRYATAEEMAHALGQLLSFGGPAGAGSPFETTSINVELLETRPVIAEAVPESPRKADAGPPSPGQNPPSELPGFGPLPTDWDMALPDAGPVAWGPSLEQSAPGAAVRPAPQRSAAVEALEELWAGLSTQVAARPGWIAGGGLAVVLLAAVMALVLSRPGRSITDGMAPIDGGQVHLGNSTAKVRAYLQVLRSDAAPPAWLDPNRQFDEALVQDLEAEQDTYVPPFWIDQREVTNAQYADFILATGRTPPEDWTGSRPPRGREDHPVVNVSYDDAVAYAQWAGKELPTSAQWTRAFREADDRLFPWGDTYQPSYARTREGGHSSPGRVGTYPDDRSTAGAYDLVGNVSEFVREERLMDGRQMVGVKGASYLTYALERGIGGVLRWSPRDEARPYVGFRCVLEGPVPTQTARRP
jgi:formylglycine-generating enzyme required for sulfatase activity